MKLTLTNVSNFIRKYGPIFILFVIVFFIVYYSVKIGIIIYKARKGPEIYYNPIFGVINKPKIRVATESAKFNFEIDTVEGKPVTTTASANIYLIPPTETKFGYRNRLFVMAENFGIINPSQVYKLNEKHALFNDEYHNLEVDITNFNFTYKYLYENNIDTFDFIKTPIAKEAENEAKAFLQKIDKLPGEFKDAKVQIKYFYFDVNKKTLTQVKKNLDANIVEVGFIRPDLDTLTFISNSYPNFHNFLRFIPTYDGYELIQAQIKYFDKSSENFGVYPVKTADEAYKLLKKGKAKIINLSDTKDKIIIKKIYLAYYDPDIYEEYLQPVYVFESNNNFTALIPALIEEYLSD